MSQTEADSVMKAADLFLNDPGGMEAPQAVAAVVRDEAPVCRTSEDSYLVTGYEEAQAIYKDPRFSSAAASGRIAGWLNAYPLDPEKLSRAVTLFENMIQESDDPKHGRLRTAIRPAFSVRSVEKWQPAIERIVSSLIRDVSAKPTFDVVQTLAYPLSCHVISEVMGLPFADHEKWEAWTVAIAELSRTRPPTEPEVSRLVDAAVSFIDYFHKVIDNRRRGEPRDDLVSALLDANSVDQLSDDELVAMLADLVMAGHDTTANMVVNGLYWMLTNLTEYEKVRTDPSLVPYLVEEILRYEPSAPFPLPRCPLEAINLEGVPIVAGAHVVVANSAANRDPRRFQNPDRFDVGRYQSRAAAPHLTFGFGAHRCIGERLAKTELQSMFHAIVTELPLLKVIDRGSWRKGFQRRLDYLIVVPN